MIDIDLPTDLFTFEQLEEALGDGVIVAIAATTHTCIEVVGLQSGRQFVVIAAGGNPALKTRIGTKVIAYALPHPLVRAHVQ